MKNGRRSSDFSAGGWAILPDDHGARWPRSAYITSADRGVLERIAAMIEEAVSDDRLLLQAIENADDLE
jgi:hypothetical protein